MASTLTLEEKLRRKLWTRQDVIECLAEFVWNIEDIARLICSFVPHVNKVSPMQQRSTKTQVKYKIAIFSLNQLSPDFDGSNNGSQVASEFSLQPIIENNFGASRMVDTYMSWIKMHDVSALVSLKVSNMVPQSFSHQKSLLICNSFIFLFDMKDVLTCEKEKQSKQKDNCNDKMFIEWPKSVESEFSRILKCIDNVHQQPKRYDTSQSYSYDTSYRSGQQTVNLSIKSKSKPIHLVLNNINQFNPRKNKSKVIRQVYADAQETQQETQQDSKDDSKENANDGDNDAIVVDKKDEENEIKQDINKKSRFSLLDWFTKGKEKEKEKEKENKSDKKKNNTSKKEVFMEDEKQYVDMDVMNQAFSTQLNYCGAKIKHLFRKLLKSKESQWKGNFYLWYLEDCQDIINIDDMIMAMINDEILHYVEKKR